MTNETNGNGTCPVCDRPLPVRPLLVGENGRTRWVIGRWCDICRLWTERRPGSGATFVEAEKAMREAGWPHTTPT